MVGLTAAGASGAGSAAAGVASGVSTGLVSSTGAAGAAAGVATGSDIMEDLGGRELLVENDTWSDDASQYGFNKATGTAGGRGGRVGRKQGQEGRTRTHNSGIWEESEGTVALLAQGRGESEREREIGRRINLAGGALLILKQPAQTRLN